MELSVNNKSKLVWKSGHDLIWSSVPLFYSIIMQPSTQQIRNK
jgi:hypothetical protein